MAFLAALWLPILVSAVFVFIASALIHMCSPMHKGDLKKMKNEDAVLESLRASGVGPGEYMFPCADSMKDMGSPEMLEKFKRGPVGWMTIIPAERFNMNTSLAAWFIHCLILGTLIAYLTWHALGPGAAYLRVFQIAGAAAVLGHAFIHVPNSIWKGESWRVTFKFFIDGVICSLITAGTFGWLWPAA
ncbi:MAG: hypothetical protein IT450_07830 [Phycisphaerales bacterium]|nr:hypothetical protein [Phycisphaerales bacterium]